MRSWQNMHFVRAVFRASIILLIYILYVSTDNFYAFLCFAGALLLFSFTAKRAINQFVNPKQK